MATHTRYFRSDDPGAPVLTGDNQGALIQILRQCLVGDGSGIAYGTGDDAKTAAGWTEEFTGTYKAAFRNSLTEGGTGCYFRIEETNSRRSTLNTYRTMSDVDTGVDVAGPFYGMSSYTATSTARFWQVFADELTFYMAIDAAANTYGHNMLIIGGGDITSVMAADDYRYFCTGDYTSTISNQGFCSLVVPSDRLYVARKAGLVLGSGYASTYAATNAAVQCYGIERGSVNYNEIGGWGAGSYPMPGNDGIYLQPSTVVHDGSVRGFLRGVYTPYCRIDGFGNGNTIGTVPGMPAGSDLRTALGCQTDSLNYYPGGLLIETGVSW